MAQTNKTIYNQRRVLYGGKLSGYKTVYANYDDYPDVHLECFHCHDESLYHDSIAYWSELADDLLCVKCYQKGKEVIIGSMTDYKRVLTQH